MIKNLINLKLFQNNEMTKFYWSIFIMSFGESLINIFVPIYLYNLGFKIPQILFFYFLVSLYFLFFAWIGRIFADNAFRVLLVDSYKNLTEKILHLIHNYDLAQRQNYFEFVILRKKKKKKILIFHFDFHPFAFSFLIAALCSLGCKLIEK